MTGKILALLFSVALTFASGAAQARDPYTFNASAEAVAEVQNNRTLPPTAGRDDDFRGAALLQAASTTASWKHTFETMLEVHDNPVLPPKAGRDDFRVTALTQAAATAASWKNTLKTMFDPHNVARSCLATAVYFEARSESQLGQLAVAAVILNRAKTSNYPSSICGVVYQGASRLNACQFSFACDGQSDLPQNGRAWETALAVSALALAGDGPLRIVADATCYHADYVDPSWSKSLHRVTKIGRHIFYSQG